MNRCGRMARGSLWLPMAVMLLLAAGPIGATAAAEGPAHRADPSVRSATQPPHVPLLAYYYIWFNTSSWDRAKTDYPLLGRYSSDDKAIMQQHVRWAKAAGIDGFIVSWKSTDVLNRRLTLLIEVANEERFKLVIIYQGLDVKRAPLPTDRVAADLDLFSARYASAPAFDLFGRPVVIWSGTWKFSRDEVARVTGPRRARLRILASERNPEAYRHLADVVDGDAYYWSSVNPETYPNYPEKLAAMAQAVHANHGLWLAPAAPGFDARLIGGKQVVERKNGVTLRQEMTTALASTPDAIGLISWNEFSENSAVEPSCTYGTQSLAVVADIRGGTAPTNVPTCPVGTPVAASTGTPDAATDDTVNVDTEDGPNATPGTTGGEQVRDTFDFDSSSPGDIHVGLNSGIVGLGGLLSVVVVSTVMIARRSRRPPPKR